jgi:hypothetical protein
MLALCIVASGPAVAQVITFEVDPSGAGPVDDAALGMATPYTVGSLAITFGIDGNLDNIADTPAFFEHSGTEGLLLEGFVGCLGIDIAHPLYALQMGQWFLRATPGADFGQLVIDYAGGTVNGASGEIWDIDGIPQNGEQYRVRAFNSSGTLLATIDSPASTQDSGCLNTELDSRPWVFNFSLTPGIAKITIDFIGTKTAGIGLAFNNFNATGEQPTPARKASWGRVKAAYR